MICFNSYSTTCINAGKRGNKAYKLNQLVKPVSMNISDHEISTGKITLLCIVETDVAGSRCFTGDDLDYSKLIHLVKTVMFGSSALSVARGNLVFEKEPMPLCGFVIQETNWAPLVSGEMVEN